MPRQRAARRRRRVSDPPRPTATTATASDDDVEETHPTLARAADPDPDLEHAHGDPLGHTTVRTDSGAFPGPGVPVRRTAAERTDAVIDREDEQVRRAYRSALVAACGVALTGVGCALALYFALHSVEADRFTRAWDALCEQNVRLLDVAFNQRLANSARNVAAYLYAVPVISEENLYEFTNRSSFDMSILTAVGSHPILTYEQLPQFEAHYNLQVWPKPLPPESTVRVDGRPIVSPVLFVYPAAVKPGLLGFNQMSYVSRRAGILALLRSPTKQIAMSDPLRLVPYNHRGFLIWVRALPRPTADHATPFTDWMGTISVETTTILTVALGTQASSQGVFMDILHPTGELIFTTVPANTTRHRLLHTASRTYTVPVLDQTWTARCFASTRFRHSLVTTWPAAIAAITAAVFAVAGEATRRGVLRWHAAQRALTRYAGQDEMLAMLARSGRAVLEALPDALLVVNSRGRLLGINAAAVALTGYSVTDLEQVRVTRILAPSHTAVLPETGTLPLGQFDGTLYRASGSAVPVSMSVNDTRDAAVSVSDAVAAGVTPLSADQSDAIAQVVLFHDISDQVDAQHRREVAQMDRARATGTRAALLTTLARLIVPQTRAVDDAMQALQRAAAVMGTGSPPRRTAGRARISSAADELAAGVTAAQHMAALGSDLALLVDVPRSFSDGGSTNGVRLCDLMDEALAARDREVSGKRVAVLTAADPPGVRIAGPDLAAVRILIAKMLLIGSVVAADGAVWSVRYSVLRGRLVLHQELSAMSTYVDLAGLDDLGLQHASLGQHFGALPLTYLALIRYVRRLEGTFARSADSVKGIMLHVEVPLAKMGVWAIFPSGGGRS
ncbi:PAS domain S-box protein [Allomyces macrogynus ATCC 38327]|uniref:PAS domain S-box protein n=1 Tax=Allomyces macrogynus (strain ATCC 38327) TaxID=578462 RepID=A0A0L0T624_ALLM3|nr:PAS domain S-box protein [Allomyces macrogynus ATCC 38327]|eukprot:KNE70141.1 PAS domain S-box protein [Allomyces macrogynus ATCC 38327]